MSEFGRIVVFVWRILRAAVLVPSCSVAVQFHWESLVVAGVGAGLFLLSVFVCSACFLSRLLWACVWCDCPNWFTPLVGSLV